MVCAGAFAVGTGAFLRFSMSSSAPATSVSTSTCPFSRVATVASPSTPDFENTPDPPSRRVRTPEPLAYSRTARVMSTADGSTNSIIDVATSSACATSSGVCRSCTGGLRRRKRGSVYPSRIPASSSASRMHRLPLLQTTPPSPWTASARPAFAARGFGEPSERPGLYTDCAHGRLERGALSRDFVPPAGVGTPSAGTPAARGDRARSGPWLRNGTAHEGDPSSRVGRTRRGRGPLAGRGLRGDRRVPRRGADAVRGRRAFPGVHHQRVRPPSPEPAARGRTEDVSPGAHDRSRPGLAPLHARLLATEHVRETSRMMAGDWYRTRIAEWTTRRDAAAGRGVVLSRLRLVTFLAAVALLWWGLDHRQPIANMLGVASLAAFAALVVVHARVLNVVDRAEAARRINTHGLARLARDWAALPEVPVPADFDMDAHPYARDLDLFGHASLTKWLGRPATTDGARRLWQWLLVAAEPADSEARQPAIEELAPKREWRELFDGGLP